ncbi:MAG TPA: hypothetical protein D7H83_08150 [Candidatus Poseidoniales archaeon]|nr:MAG TPA: hypothetical protein D7H83_08150 [Candidatus Poseidoniales archaeon]HIH58355.1 hypothetical protein [Candidatus Poseidoniaceae archaeon]|tara:strand:- start:9614 stop:10456 length:843 start_codon:yes stop_codon:yes gene_type:complete
MRAILVACLFATVAFLPGFSDAHGIPGAHSEGYIADVLVVDLNCEENHTCVSRPSNIVEYYGADWCEECPAVEDQLRNVTGNSSIILSHRPSSSDDFWLQESKERFLDVYGLWGYPTIAVDGHYILAGPTQSQELNSLLSESESNYSGISNLTLSDGNITLEGNFTNMSIDIWTLHADDNLTYLVTNHTNYSQSNSVDISGDKLVIVLSKPGYIALISGSSMPANDYIPDGGIDSIETETDSISGSTVIIITILLLMISLPATYQLFQVMRTPTPPIEEE